MNLNAPPFDFEQDGHNDHQPYPQIFGQNIHPGASASSSSSISCHIFLNSPAQDHNGYYHQQLYQPDHSKEDDAYAYSGGSSTDKAESSGLKLTLWKKEPEDDHHDMVDERNDNDPVKWMSSKMRLMQKMKNSPDHHHDHRRPLKINTTKLQEATDDFSSKNSSHSNNNSPIRVCGDCNTTKTPLWRSGPKGPKSLCNACGIRQRKARRALAAATANGTAVASDQTTTNASLKIKLQNKDKNIICKTTHGSTVPLKKRYKMAAAAAAASSTTSDGSRTKIEDFLMNFSKKLTFHRVFPEDEKDAAILLMALSSGLIHG